jgi:DNA-binding transcriptional LysR family regulator
MNIDYRYLKAFHLVGELLNFSKAAKELKIAQSAVSRQIKLLEEALAEQLIIRSSKKVILTDKGKELYNLINQFEMQTQKIFFHEEEQVIRVGILHGLLENWFIQVIEAFNKKSKNPITVQIGTPDDLGKRLIKGEIDVIFTSEEIDNELVTSLKLFEEHMVLISQGEFNLKDISKTPWIIYDENDYLMKLYKKRPARIIQVASITAIIKMVEMGDGVAIVPVHALNERHNLVQQEIKGFKKTHIYMTTLNYKSWPAPIKLLKDTVMLQMI